jgi:hypothetical protein
LLFTIGKFLIGLYLGKSSIASVYGAAGSLVIIVVWVYYSAQILLFGAEFTKGMLHLARLARVHQAAGQPLGQLQLRIEALEQDRPAVRTGVRHVEAATIGFPLGSNPNVICGIQA